MNAALPICVLGGGLVGARHAEVAMASDQVRLTAVVEPDDIRRKALAAQGLPVIASATDVPGDTRAAIIATPTCDHLSCALWALEQGWPVLVEKPITGTMAEAVQLIAAGVCAGQPIIAGHHRRCHPFVPVARKALSQIGSLVGVQGVWSLRKPASYFDPPWRRAPGAGVLMINLIHEIDMLQVLLGGISEVMAMSSTASRGLTVEDTAALSLRFENGTLGSFLISDAGDTPWSFESATGENPGIASSAQDYISIIGTKGALTFPSLTVWKGGGNWSLPQIRQTPAPLPRIDPLAEQINRFAKVVAGGKDNLLCTFTEGAAALEMTLATALSAQTGRRVKRGEVPSDYDGRQMRGELQ